MLCMEWNNKMSYMHGLEMAFPFLDRDLISFLMGIPGEVVTWEGVPKAILREGMRGVLPDAIVQRTWKADSTHLLNDGMAHDYVQLVQRLEEGGMAVRLGYVKGDVMKDELRRLKDRIGGSHSGASLHLTDLLGLEVWLQVFFGEKTGGKEGLEHV